jgi:hypothetical protein
LWEPDLKILRALALVLLGTSLALADAPITFDLDTPRQAGSAALADPDTGLVTNSAIDIIEHNAGVWLGTGKGVMFSYDNGQTWLRYDASNGLVSSNLSAIFSAPDGRLWIGSAHGGAISGETF